VGGRAPSPDDAFLSFASCDSVAMRLASPATVSALGAGETYDFLWTPDRPMEAILTMGNVAEGFAIRQALRVR